jgi:hypothetical protein
MAIFTLVITFIFHNFWGVPAEQVMQQQQAFFKNIAVVGGPADPGPPGARWLQPGRQAWSA